VSRTEIFRQNADRAAALAEGIGDGHDTVPDSKWTTGELVAHLIAMCDNLTGMARGAGRPYAAVDTVAQENDEMIAEVTTHDTATLRDAAKRLADELAAGSPERMFKWHAGIDVTADTAAGIATGEMLVHGYDLAKALRQPWKIPPGDAAVVLDSLLNIVPNFVDQENAAGLRAVYDVRLRGRSSRYRIAFDDGACTVDRLEKVRDADCRMSADPVAFLLVSFGRRSQWWAAATGKVTAWGRKPWLGFKFASLLRAP
jgi:uncharacterized protein (TIGR03083 family)